MRKIKLFMGAVLLTSLLGVTSFAAVNAGTNGVSVVENADTVQAINENAEILGTHIDDVATSKFLGHIKIGTGLEMTGEGEVKDVANVKIGTGLQITDGAVSAKIANDLSTDDPETALSAAMGVELYNLLISNTAYDTEFSLPATDTAVTFNKALNSEKQHFYVETNIGTYLFPMNTSSNIVYYPKTGGFGSITIQMASDYNSLVIRGSDAWLLVKKIYD